MICRICTNGGYFANKNLKTSEIFRTIKLNFMTSVVRFLSLFQVLGIIIALKGQQ